MSRDATGRATGSTGTPVGGGRLPDYLIIGAMKSGTTTLHAYLARHPQVHGLREKEPGFFSRDERYGEGIAAYRTLFAEAAPTEICGEASTCYARLLEYPQAAKRIAEHLPDVKLLYIMRHPVERAYSHYAHVMAHLWTTQSTEPMPFEAALDAFPTILDTGHYERQLGAYEALFPGDQILLMTLDELMEDPRTSLERVRFFLDLPPWEGPGAEELRKNTAGFSVARRTAYREFNAYRGHPVGKVMRRMLPRTARRWIRGRALERLPRSAATRQELAAFRAALPPMTDELRRRLLREFEESTVAIEEKLGRGLSRWKS